MRLIDADALKNAFYNQECWSNVIEYIIDNAPTVIGIINAEDFKKRINNMEYIYIQSCAEDVIDAIDCEVTYFNEKMSKYPNSNS